MSRYTTQLRNYIEQTYRNTHPGVDVSTVEVQDRCVAVAPVLFNFTYPIWDESKRLDFEKDFMVHFYFEEIGAETMGQWKVFLCDWLNTNMPYYNMKFKSLYSFYEGEMDKLYGNKVSESFQGSGDSSEMKNTQGSTESSQDTSGNNSGMQKYYEVPSGNISSITDHLNNAMETSGEGSNHSTATSKNMSDDTGSREYKDQHTITKDIAIGAEKASTLLKLTGELNNVKQEMYRKMSILFMGVL